MEPRPPAPGRVVPVFALTGGRTRSSDGADLPVETLVTCTASGRQAGGLQPEYRRTVAMTADRPQSIAEIGAHLGVPVGVARVLVADLVAAGHLAVHLPPAAEAGVETAILERLLGALRAR